MHLELLYCPFGVENGLVNPFSSDFSMTSLEKVLKSGENGTGVIGNGNEVTQKRREVIIRGVLAVTVISAEDLPMVDLMGKADPFVTLTMKKSEMRNKTRVRFHAKPWNFFGNIFKCYITCDFFINLALFTSSYFCSLCISYGEWDPWRRGFNLSLHFCLMLLAS